LRFNDLARHILEVKKGCYEEAVNRPSWGNKKIFLSVWERFYIFAGATFCCNKKMRICNRIIICLLLVLMYQVDVLAVDIPKGTFYFDNSLTQYNNVQFVYGKQSENICYVRNMTSEGNDIWSITFDETVSDMYRYTFSNTTMDEGLIEDNFPNVKEYISKTLLANRTATASYTIPVGYKFTPSSGDNWAQGSWQPLDGNTQEYSGTLPVMYINTTNNQAITSKDTYLTGTYYIDALGLEGYESLGSKEAPLGLQIKGRGNYTWTGFNKKPYRLRFDEKAKPLGMKKNRHFVLIANADDDLCGLRNTVGYEVSRMLGMPYTPEQRPVELVLNGDYVGLYMLTDKIRVSKDRVNITEQSDLQTDPDSITGGWLFEINNYDEDQQIKISEGNGATLRFSYHSPDILSSEQTTYLTNLVTAADEAIYESDKGSTNWEQIIDMDILARYYIVQEVMDDAESFHGSCYMYKDMGADAKIMFGPVWDFGNSFRRGYDKFIYDNPPYGQNWIAEIARFPRFQTRVRELWQAFYGRNYPLLESFIDQYIDQISGAAVADAVRWPNYGTTDVESKKSTFLYRITQKTNFLREKWGEGLSGIDDVETLRGTMDDRWFTLDGRLLQHAPTMKGIYIHKGKKVVIR